VQKVQTGVVDGDRVQVVSGVSPGDEVVVDGADRLRDGAKVRIANDSSDPAANVSAASEPASHGGAGAKGNRHGAGDAQAPSDGASRSGQSQ
jgi:multidrug efflux system membrane fusion protein